MGNVSADFMVGEVRASLAQVFARLSPHAARIATAWRKALRRSEPCDRHAPILSTLQLTVLLADFGSAQPRAYKEEAENEGQNLARRGVPAECAMLAVTHYVESCLPFLCPRPCSEQQGTKALLRWGAAYQYFLQSGYRQFEHHERQYLEERAVLAECRSQDFAVELGDAYEKERQRLARDLHDEIGHDLIVLKLYTDVILKDLRTADTTQLRKKLRESLCIIRRAIKGVRHLTFDLGPAIWNEQGFLPAVRLYARQYATRTGLKVRVDTRRVQQKLPARYESALYKVLQGALANIVAHARASHVAIHLSSTRNQVSMRISDDGRGFNVGRVLSSPRLSYGLRAMRDRIELLGGTVNFTSQAVKRGGGRSGTLIEIRLPLFEADVT